MNNLAITNSYEAYKNCEKGKDKMFQFIDEIEQSKLDKKTKENMKKLCTTAHIYFGTYQKFLDNSTNKNKMQFEQDFAWVNSELQNNGFDPATYQN